MVTPDTKNPARLRVPDRDIDRVRGVAVSRWPAARSWQSKSWRNTVSAVMMECPFPVWFSAGATMMGEPIA